MSRSSPDLSQGNALHTLQEARKAGILGGRRQRRGLWQALSGPGPHDRAGDMQAGGPDPHLSPTDTASPPSASPSSSSPASPAAAGHTRPSSLHGLAAKLGPPRPKAGRRKSTSSIPPSPLACPPVPVPPPRSPSPLPGHPPAPARSPRLRRGQSADKLGSGERLDGELGRRGRGPDSELVVMRRLHLSERRDSFKKQEAVQEVSFDEPPEEAAGPLTSVPQIAVEGAEAVPGALGPAGKD